MSKKKKIDLYYDADSEKKIRNCNDYKNISSKNLLSNDKNIFFKKSQSYSDSSDSDSDNDSRYKTKKYINRSSDSSEDSNKENTQSYNSSSDTCNTSDNSNTSDNTSDNSNTSDNTSDNSNTSNNSSDNATPCHIDKKIENTGTDSDDDICYKNNKKYDKIENFNTDSDDDVCYRKKNVSHIKKPHIVIGKIREDPKISSNEIFKSLIKNQLSDVPIQWKLNISDMKRICKYVNTSIFDKHKCCIWNGYITNVNNSNKGTYINFYFKKKKVALHRLLYSNFVAPLDSSEYLKFNCDNKGICCNVNHYEKYKYSKIIGLPLNNKESKIKEKKKDQKVIIFYSSDNPKQTYIDFD